MKNNEEITISSNKDQALISDFYFYKNTFSLQYFETKSIKYFPKYILSAEKYKNKSKEESTAFIINQLKNNNNRQTDNFDSANCIMIDIDFKNIEHKNQFINEYNNYDKTISFDDNITKFMEDVQSLAWITARSFSGKGIHIFFYFINKLEDNSIIYSVDGEDFTADDVHKSNYKAAEKMIIEKTGYKMNDKCGLVITQPTLPCRKIGSYVNDIFYIKYFKNKKIQKTTRVDAINLNSKLNLNIENLSSEINKIKIDLHYNEDITKLCSALQIVKNEEIRILFYNFINNNYNGDNKIIVKALRSYQSFYKHIDKQKWGKYNISLQYIFNKYGIVIKNTNNEEDLYGQTFDKIYYYDDYLTHFDIENNEDIIINANTGAGKTTVAIKHLAEKEGIKAFVCPTNLICEQTYEKYNGKYNLKRCYGGQIDQDIFNEEDCIYITNIQSCKLLNNIKFTSVVYDECHKLIDYSIFNENNHNKPYFYLNSDQNIYISATSDKWKCFRNDVKYIKYVKKDLVKRKINIKHFKQNKMRFEMVLNFIKNNPSKNYMIYHNNKNENKTLLDKLKDFGFSLVDSENKKDSYLKIVNDNEAHNLIVTSIINDGVNINNKVDYVFIIDNMTQTIEDLYQFSNRFRTSLPIIYFLRLNNYSKKDLNYRDIKIYDLINQLYKDKIIKLESDKIAYNNFDHSYSVKTSIDQYKKFIVEKITAEKSFYKIGDVYHINYQLVMRDIISEINTNILKNQLDFNFYMSYYFDIENKRTNKDISEDNIKEINKKDAKDLFFKYLKSKAELKNLEDIENDIYIKYKKTIDNYFKRYCEVEAISNKINNEVMFDIKKLTSDRTIYNNELKGFVLKVSKKREEKKMLFEKGDLLNLQNNNQIINILENVKTMDEFIFSIKELNILESNKIDTTDMKSINKGIKKFGYRFRFMKGKIRLEKNN